MEDGGAIVVGGAHAPEVTRPRGEGVRGDLDGGDAILDDKARMALKARIRDLQEGLAEAEDMNDLGRAERLRAELDQLVGTLASALGLGGRGRRIGSLCERARTTVSWRIRYALRRIEGVHEPLARHLANSLRTGTFCSYRPERPVAWRLEDAAAAQGAPSGPRVSEDFMAEREPL
jgi:hypothetical protein